LRKDYSLDLVKARQTILSGLVSLLGDVRDFNGGMLAQQVEIFDTVKASVCHVDQYNDFLLENFFYSLTPSLMSSLLPSSLLKSLFLMQLEILDIPRNSARFSITCRIEGRHMLIMIASSDASFKEQVLSSVSQLKIPTSSLGSTAVEMYGTYTLGFIYGFEKEEKRKSFYDAVLQKLNEWESSLTIS
jgi:hypothetical protein